MRKTVIAAITVCIVALAGNTFWVDSKTGRQRRATGARLLTIPLCQRTYHHGLEDRRAPTIKLDEEQPIAVRELDPTAHPALQHNQLFPQRGILCFKSVLPSNQNGRGFRHTQGV
jgi:hypothetical protein